LILTPARKWIANGAILTHRNEPERAIYTISSGFRRGRYYRQLRSVKNYFRRMKGSRDFGQGWRVIGMLAVGHFVKVTGHVRRHKGEQFTPELLRQSVGQCAILNIVGGVEPFKGSTNGMVDRLTYLRALWGF
jgi:hypothetical protein